MDVFGLLIGMKVLKTFKELSGCFRSFGLLVFVGFWLYVNSKHF